MSNRFTLLLITIALMFLSGCASTGGDQRDPIEGLNRSIYNFNEGLDKMVFKPVAKGYQAVVPDPVDKGVTNFFDNINDVVTTINGLLQFKFRQGGSDAARVLINSTLGILGLFDVASKMGFEKHDEDFGQTLGYWGLGHGPYIVLPILGPSSLRDATGRFVDASAFDPLYQVDHIPTRNSLKALEAIDRRSDLLGATSVFEQAALDKYNFLKESYFQQRENAVNDGELTFPE